MIHVGVLLCCFLLSRFMHFVDVLKKLLFCCCANVILVFSSSSCCSNGNWTIRVGQIVGSLEVGSEDRSWILCSAAVRCHINGRKKSFARPDFTCPPMLFRSICYSDHIASSEVQLATFLCCKVI